MLPLEVDLSPLADNIVDAGYHFANDTTFYANSWNILHDESLYPDP